MNVVPWKVRDGRTTVDGMEIVHLLTAIWAVRQAHPGKKMPHPIIVTFFDEDKAMLPPDEMHRLVALLLGYWGVFTANVRVNLAALIHNAMLDDRAWRDPCAEGKALPGMPDYVEASRPFGGNPLDPLLATMREDLATVRAAKGSASTRAARKMYEESAQELSRKIEMFERRDASTPWLFDMLKEGYSDSVDAEMESSSGVDWFEALERVIAREGGGGGDRKRKREEGVAP